MFWVVQASPSPKIRLYAFRSALNRPFNQWMMAYAASAKFEYVPAQMMEMIQAFAGSWTQSRINELANKILREMECKTNLSKAPRNGTIQFCLLLLLSYFVYILYFVS